MATVLEKPARRAPQPAIRPPEPAAASRSPWPVNDNAADPEDPYAHLRREAPSVGRSGVHPGAIALCGGAYAAMLLAFWAGFAGPGYVGVVLAVVTGFMIVYFSLILGGIAVADSARPGTLRSFHAFLNGRVDTATGPLTGREALVMIAGLPAALAVLAAAIGVIAHIVQFG